MSTRQLILALDQGTTGSTALVVDPAAQVLGRGYREIPQHYPQPGWVEHDPEDLWSATLAAAKDALAAARVAGGDLAAIGITNQRETTLLWDRKSGAPLARAIVWQDRRTAERCRSLDADRIAATTGLVPDPYFSATKLEWLLGRLKPAPDRTAFGTVDSWLVHRLTRGRAHVTDPTNASRTMLYDIGAGRWDDGLLEMFGVPREILPRVTPSSGVVATADADWLGAEVPIAGIAGDQQAALFGQGCFSAGTAKNTYGTGAFLLLNTGDLPVRSTHGLLTTVACDARGQPAYALEGSIFVAGAAIQWLRDGLGLLDHAAESEALARSVPDTAGAVFVPAFVGLGAPHWESGARGAIFGLTRGTTKAHLVRAALEAMAYSTREVLEAMTGDAGLTLSGLRVDGGAAANDWLMQFQADVLGLSVTRPEVVESTAMGAAGLAGLATGVWKTAADFLAARRFKTFEPGGRDDRGWDEWKRAVAATVGWATWPVSQ
jgi:glycerol kinase